MQFWPALTMTLMIALLQIDCPKAFAGGMISGGGNFVTDGNNPWWIQNTEGVRYCVAIDAKHFHLERAVAEKLIARAFSYWKKQFASVNPTRHSNMQPPEDQIFIARQNFIQTKCDDKVDLTFQLGFLTKEQQQVIPDTNAIAAVTYRNNYNRVNLRGNGFIYISPDSGPFRYQQDSALQQPWQISNGGFFYATVVHELGHVFGVPHKGARRSLMHETFVEDLLVLERQYAEKVADRFLEKDLPEFFMRRRFYGEVSCLPNPRVPSIDPFVERVLGIPDLPIHECSQKIFDGDTLKILSGPTDNTLRVVGEAKITYKEFWPDYIEGVTFWMPKEQKVFPPIKGPQRIGVQGIYVGKFKGVYEVKATGFKTSIFFELTPDIDLVPLRGSVDGQIYMNLRNGY